MIKKEFHHMGVPTSQKMGDESHNEERGIYVTDAESHPYRIEYLRFDPDSNMPEMVRTTPHIAYMVDSLEEALKGQELVCEAFDANESLRVAFFKDGDALIEVMQEL